MVVRRVLVALAVVALAGCSDVTPGRPMADPDQTGLTTTTTTTTTTPPRESPRAPGGPPPEGLAATTCGDYVSMDDAAKREVIEAIGEDNELVGMNPELWVGVADMMCAFTEKSTLVRDAVAGGGFR
ncbi:hypothetical protein [Mycobacterium hubeiense]|uniref:hypothetical protein n=1 Tax=Mycobacterium hubeiense TaxID=1867256 RepID=UPI001E469737|nr:hypothetical protein [Mycobacterium sp. QGD 101]